MGEACDMFQNQKIVSDITTNLEKVSKIIPLEHVYQPFIRATRSCCNRILIQYYKAFLPQKLTQGLGVFLKLITKKFILFYMWINLTITKMQ